MKFQNLKQSVKNLVQNCQQESRKEDISSFDSDISMISVNVEQKTEKKYYDDIAENANILCGQIYSDLNSKNFFGMPKVSNNLANHILDEVTQENVFSVLLGYSMISERGLIETIVNSNSPKFEQRKLMAKHLMDCAVSFAQERNVDTEHVKIELEIALEDKTRTIEGISDELIARVLFSNLNNIEAVEFEKKGYSIMDTLESIANSTSGKEALEACVETLPSENYKVNLAGINRKYFITKEEITIDCQDKISLKAIEIALSTYLKEFDENLPEYKIREIIVNAIAIR